VLVKVLVPAYFARKDTRTPVITAALSLTVNVALNFALIPSLGLFGLALAGSLGAWCNAAMLYGILHRNGHYRLSMLVLGRIARIGLATAVMTAALLFAVSYAMPLVTGALGERLLAIGGLVGLGAIIFFGLAFLFGVVNRDTIGQLRRRKA
jgi:putative peptidoglycan lipid II flippase